jgi:predicted dehydrogenase
VSRPRLGFLGVGWIGRHRMEAMLATGLVDVVGVADPSDDMAGAALALAPTACRAVDLEDLLALDLDGVVIATPSALHADQARRTLQAGVAVFCQKPLARTAQETADVISAAEAADRLLGVDMSYRHTAAAIAVRDQIRSGTLGPIHAMDLTFHNAWGPDKPWFRDRALSGGGCVMDLGVHLVDLALWMLDGPKVVDVHARLFTNGRRWDSAGSEVEDYAVASLTLADGAVVRLACSWNLPAGAPAVIGLQAYGARGGAGMRNLDGSFYDFAAEQFSGPERSGLTSPPDDWSGAAARGWARALHAENGFDPSVEDLTATAAIVDGIYAAAA